MSKDNALAMLSGEPVAPAPPSPGLTSVPEAPAAPAAQPMESDWFAKKAKWESDRVKKELEFKKEKEAILAERDKAAAVLKERQEIEALRKTDPVAAMKREGYSETEIFNFLAAHEKKELTPEEKAAEIAKKIVDERLEADAKARADAEAKAVQERDGKILQGFKGEITKTLDASKDKYPFSARKGAIAESLAYDTVLAVVRESQGQEVITVQEALDLVEGFYKDEYLADKAIEEEMAKKNAPATTEETKAAAERTRTVSTPAGHEPPKPTITKTRTLTNSATATVASTATRGKETREQKRERLEAWLRTGVKPA